MLAREARADTPKKGGTIAVATAGEPPTLDPMESPADVVGMISQHIFETLYTWGDGWRIVPLLAADMPAISEGGRVYTIPLRSSVAFHDGTTMTSADVLASLERWMSIAQRGQQTKENVESVTAPDERTIRIALKQPFAPLMSLLSLQTSAAIIIPRGNQKQPMADYIGTGPYRFVARMPDRYVQLRRFDGYVAPHGCSHRLWRAAHAAVGRDPFRAGSERGDAGGGRSRAPRPSFPRSLPASRLGTTQTRKRCGKRRLSTAREALRRSRLRGKRSRGDRDQPTPARDDAPLGDGPRGGQSRRPSSGRTGAPPPSASAQGGRASSRWCSGAPAWSSIPISRATKVAWLLDHVPGGARPRRAGRARLWDRRYLPALAPDGRRGPRHRRLQRLAHAALRYPRAAPGMTNCWRSSACRGRSCRRSATAASFGERAPGLSAPDSRSPASPATSRPPFGQACFRARNGQGYLRHRLLPSVNIGASPAASRNRLLDRRRLSVARQARLTRSRARSFQRLSDAGFAVDHPSRGRAQDLAQRIVPRWQLGTEPRRQQKIVSWLVRHQQGAACPLR